MMELGSRLFSRRVGLFEQRWLRKGSRLSPDDVWLRQFFDGGLLVRPVLVRRRSVMVRCGEKPFGQSDQNTVSIFSNGSMSCTCMTLEDICCDT